MLHSDFRQGLERWGQAQLHEDPPSDLLPYVEHLSAVAMDPSRAAATLPVPGNLALDLFAYGDYIGSEALMRYATPALPLAYEVFFPDAFSQQGRLFPWNWRPELGSFVQDERFRTQPAAASEARPTQALPALCALLRALSHLQALEHDNTMRYTIVENVVCPIEVRISVKGRDHLNISIIEDRPFDWDLAQAVETWIETAEWRNSEGRKCRKREELERCTIRLIGSDLKPTIHQHATKLEAQDAVSRGEDECLLFGEWFKHYWFGNPVTSNSEKYFSKLRQEWAESRRRRRWAGEYSTEYYQISTLRSSEAKISGVALTIANCETQPHVFTYRAACDMLAKQQHRTPGRRKVHLFDFFSKTSYERGPNNQPDKSLLDWRQCDLALAEGLIAFLLSPLHKRRPCIVKTRAGDLSLSFVHFAPLVPLPLIHLLPTEADPLYVRHRRSKRKRSQSESRRVKPKLASTN